MRRFLSLVLIISLVLSASGCSSTQKANTGDGGTKETITLRFGHNSHKESVTNKALVNWAKTVSDKTGGKLKIEIFPQNQLGTNKEMTEQTSLGSLDMNLQGLAALVDLGVQEGYLTKIPFLYRDLDHATKWWLSKEGQEIIKKAEAKNVKALSIGITRMPRQIAVKNKEVKNPEDIKGLKVRAGDTATNSTFKMLGAVPTNVSLNEMYTAVSQGIVDAVELPLDYIFDYSMYEVLNNLTLTNHQYDLQLLAINKKKFDSLPAEYQKVLIETLPAAEKENNDALKTQWDEVLKKLKDKGMKVTEIDRVQWQNIVPKVVPDLEKTWPSTKGLYDKILNLK